MGIWTSWRYSETCPWEDRGKGKTVFLSASLFFIPSCLAFPLLYTYFEALLPPPPSESPRHIPESVVEEQTGRHLPLALFF